MKYTLFYLLPKNLVSRIIGRLARLESPQFLVNAVKVWFAKRYNLNFAEAEKPLEDYPSLNAMFTRKLKEGMRPIEGDVVHPCDAVISQTGPVTDGHLIQAKGWNYSVKELIQEDLTPEIEGGSFATYYLCPTDYHRVHSPVTGYISKATHIVGKLWPVNEWSVGSVQNLFCQNERVVFKIKTQEGPVFLVMVGATNVGQMTSSHIPDLRTNVHPVKKTSYDFSQDPIAINAGDELGIFEMGSTVVLILPKRIANKAQLSPGGVQLGQSFIPQEGPADSWS